MQYSGGLISHQVLLGTPSDKKSRGVRIFAKALRLVVVTLLQQKQQYKKMRNPPGNCFGSNICEPKIKLPKTYWQRNTFQAAKYGVLDATKEREWPLGKG